MKSNHIFLATLGGGLLGLCLLNLTTAIVSEMSPPQSMEQGVADQKLADAALGVCFTNRWACQPHTARAPSHLVSTH